MLETGIALLLAHVLADFVGQTQRMIAAKSRGPVFALHILIVATTAVIALGPASAAGWAALALVVISHGLIDAAKVCGVSRAWMAGAPFRPLQVFVLDQIAHLIFIAIAAIGLPLAFQDGIWPRLLPEAGLAWWLAVATVATGFWIAARVGDLMLALFMAGFRDLWHDSRESLAHEESVDLPRAGAWIGWLERTLVFLFVLLGQFNAIGFVITAKSILRFQYARRPKASEIVIIGTLASFGWAIVIALLTHVALTGLVVVRR